MKYSRPPMAPAEITARLKAHFEPIELLAQRTEREQGKRARTEAAEARVELAGWVKRMRGANAASTR